MFPGAPSDVYGAAYTDAVYADGAPSSANGTHGAPAEAYAGTAAALHAIASGRTPMQKARAALAALTTLAAEAAAAADNANNDNNNNKPDRSPDAVADADARPWRESDGPVKSRTTREAQAANELARIVAEIAQIAADDFFPAGPHEVDPDFGAAAQISAGGADQISAGGRSGGRSRGIFPVSLGADEARQSANISAGGRAEILAGGPPRAVSRVAGVDEARRSEISISRVSGADGARRSEIAADDLLPLLVYALVRAAVPGLPAHVRALNVFFWIAL